jgi:uncharacterized small protein (DUF1192 family)
MALIQRQATRLQKSLSDISPEEAQAVMGTLDSALRLFEAGELEERIAALEERLASA